MTKDQALKLALEALHGFIPYLPLNDEAQCGRYDKAITAIKEALMSHSDGAQPEQEPVTLPENKKLILVDSSFDDLMYWLERCESKGHLENCADLIEPWEKFCDSYCVWTDHHPDCKLAQRKPLTDEEFRAILRSLSRQQGWDGDGWDLALKEAIEAAHGIKGEA